MFCVLGVRLSYRSDRHYRPSQAPGPYWSNTMCTQDLANADYSCIFNVTFTTAFYTVTRMTPAAQICTQLPRHAMTLGPADNILCLSATSSFCSCTIWLSFAPTLSHANLQACRKAPFGTTAVVHQNSSLQTRKVAYWHKVATSKNCEQLQLCVSLLICTRVPKHHFYKWRGVATLYPYKRLSISTPWTVGTTALNAFEGLKRRMKM